MNAAFYCFLAYVFMLPLEYYQEKLPKGPTGINYRTLTLVFLTAWWLIARANRQKLPFLRSPLNPIVGTYLCVVLFGSLLASFSYEQIQPVWDPGGLTFKWFLGVINGIVIFWASAALLDTRKKIRWALLAMCASSPLVFRAFYSDFQAMRGWHFSNDMRAALPFVSVGSNELGAYLVIGAVVMLVWAFAKNRLWERAAFLTGFGWYTYCIMYSFSRGSQLGFGASIALLAFLRHRWILIVMLFAALTMNFWLPVSVRERWETTTDENGQLESSAASREDFWALAIELFATSPVFGHGVGTFKLINPEGLDTHNLYLRTLAEQGLIGGVVLALIWAQLIKMSIAVWRKGEDPNDRQLGLALFAATIGLMICNIFGDRFTYLQLIGQYWMVAGIVARLYANQMGWEPFTDGPQVAPAPLVAGGEARSAASAGGPRLNIPAAARFMVEPQVSVPFTPVRNTRAGQGEDIPLIVVSTTPLRPLPSEAPSEIPDPTITGGARVNSARPAQPESKPELKITGRSAESSILLVNPRPEAH